MRLLIALALLAAPACATAQITSPEAALSAGVRPEEDRKLDASRKPAEMLAFMALKPGDRVLDVLAGNGYYSELAARIVGPKGSVMALNPPGFEKQAGPVLADRRSRSPNITLAYAQFETAPLPPPAFDAVIFHLTYHDLYWENAKLAFERTDPDRFLKRLFASLKPGGRVTVIDHAAEPGGDTRAVVEKLHRIDPAVVKADFLRAGFRLDAESQALRMPDDDRTTLVFDATVRGKTDRVAYRFVRP